MATLRIRRKLAAVSRETPKITRNGRSPSTLDPEMAQQYISLLSEEIEGRVTKKLSKEFNRTKSRFLGALSKLDELLLSPKVRTCSVAVPETSRNNNSENREPTGDRSLGDPCPKGVFSTYHSSNLNDSEQDETHPRFKYPPLRFCLHIKYCQDVSHLLITLRSGQLPSVYTLKEHRHYLRHDNFLNYYH